MKKALKTSVAAAAALLTVALPLFAAPRDTRYWRGYRVLFVNVAYPGEDVLRLAEKRGIADLVTDTPPPDVAVLFSSEPLLLPPLSERADSYYNRRKELFFDKSGAYRLFYIPEKHEKAIPALAGDLRAAGADAFWDAQEGRGPRAAQWLLGVGALVLLCEVYVARKIWRRRGWLRYFLRQPFTVPPLVLVILVNALFSLPQALLLIAVTAGILRGRLWREQRPEAVGVFVPRPIRPAVLVALGGGTTKRVLGSAAALCFVLTVLAVTSPRRVSHAQKGAKDGAKHLSFPAPAGYTDKDLTVSALAPDALPDLSHYVQWVYDRVMFPYRSLHDASSDRGYRDYKVEKGRIVEVTGLEPVLNQEFADKVLQALDEAPGNVIEQVLKKQEGFRAIRWN
jgi:hypothetical protein